MGLITTDIDHVAKHLINGKIAAIPTETVYGLAANAEDEQAIAQIYALKNRPLNHPLILHVATNWDLGRWVDDVPEYVKLIIKKYWPGPLTIVLPCQPHQVSHLVNGGQTSVALRCPSHPLAQDLLVRVGKPLVAPSANPFGKISPTTAQHVQQSFTASDLLILDGGRCTVGIESTIIDARDKQGYRILRQGSIDADALSVLLPGYALPGTAAVRVSGNLKTHYQPQKPLYCFWDIQTMKQFCQTNKQALYIISFEKDREFAEYPGYQMPQTAVQAAFEFYFQLRQADESLADIIALQLPPNTPAWQGIIERATKAGKLID